MTLPDARESDDAARHAAVIPRLSFDQAIKRLYEIQLSTQTPRCTAFYSSELGGILTDPALMLIHVDDRIITRGHAVFSTAPICQGHIHQLERRVDRLIRYANDAKVALTTDLTAKHLMDILIETAAAGGVKEGHLRFFISAGRGGFELSSKSCVRPAFYAMAIHCGEREAERREGIVFKATVAGLIDLLHSFFFWTLTTFAFLESVSIIDCLFNIALSINGIRVVSGRSSIALALLCLSCTEGFELTVCSSWVLVSDLQRFPAKGCEPKQVTYQVNRQSWRPSSPPTISPMYWPLWMLNQTGLMKQSSLTPKGT